MPARYDAAVADYALITVRVTPRSARDEVIGWRDDVLQVRLRAPPIEGRANESLRRLVASSLEVPLRDVEIVAGASSRTKRLRIDGVSDVDLRRRLEAG
jgi:uncharacterized protein (TIGR00251 family)